MKVVLSERNRRLWRDKDYRERQTRVLLRSLLKRPTSYEQKIIDLCKTNNLPFRYVGDGSFFVAGKNPDFVHETQKKLIEVFARYWKDRDYVWWREKIFAECNYSTLFLDDCDLNNENWQSSCLEKIQKFIK